MLNITPFDKPGTNSKDLTQYGENGALRQNKSAREDYYTEQGKAPAIFVGSGWAHYGKGQDDYDAELLQRALDGKDIATGEVAIKGRKNKAGESMRVMGWDFCVSPDKSYSTNYACATPEDKAKFLDAHIQACKDLVTYMEEEANTVNVGDGGKAENRDNGKFCAALYVHMTGRPTEDENGVLRPGDPDIHGHIFIPNYTINAEGKAVSLNSKELFDRKLELGAIYSGYFCENLKSSLGVHIEKHGVNNSLTRLAGSPKDVERAQSKRRMEIEALEEEIQDAMDKYGVTKGKAGDWIAKKSRKSKGALTIDGKTDFTHEEIEAYWRKELDELGYTQEMQAELFEKSRNEVREYKLDVKEILKTATQFESVFSEIQLRKCVAQAGCGVVSVDEITKCFKDLMKSDEIKKAIRFVENKKTGKITKREAYTTQEMIDIERDAVAVAAELRALENHKITPELIDRKRAEFEKEKGFTLSPDQVESLSQMCLYHDFCLVEGHAGTGKTAGVQVGAMSWREAGYTVLGACPTGKQAKGLNAAGIESVTIARLLMDAQGWTDDKGVYHPAKHPLTARTIIVIDEFAMCGSRDMQALLRLAKEAGAKVVGMGDRIQKQAVSAGGAFGLMVKKFGLDATLDTVMRQKKGTDIAEVVAHSRRGDMHKSMDILDRLGNLALVEDKDEARRTVVNAWMKRYDHNSSRAEETSLMLANTNVDTARLNRIARLHLKEAGLLDEGKGIKVEVTDQWGSRLGEKEFLENDRIMFLKNAKIGSGKSKQQVMNGETGRIMAIEGNVLTVKFDGSENTIKFSTDDYNRIDYAYAMTTHKSQGVTVDHAAILAGGGMQTLNQTYTQLSRVRYEVDFVLPKRQIEQQMAGVEPTEKMMMLAEKVAISYGHDLDELDIGSMSFLECRNYLNDYSTWIIDGKEEDERARWRREVGQVIDQMAEVEVKETTWDYEIVEKSQGVVNVYSDGKLEPTSTPAPVRYHGPARVLDLKFDKDGDAYKWKEDGTVALISQPDKVSVKSKADDAIVASLQVAKETLGNTITTNGSETFRQKTWVVGTAMGMEVRGYEPTKADHELLKLKIKEFAEAEANTKIEIQVHETTSEHDYYVPEPEELEEQESDEFDYDFEEEYVPPPARTKEDEFGQVM